MPCMEPNDVHTLDVIDSALQWETERQNKLHQQALEQKKKPEQEEAHAASVPAAARQDTPKQRADTGTGWPDKVRLIPDMRSALIPLDEKAEGSDWSKPFSLLKADMQPWLSFLEGYGQSRLFLRTGDSMRIQLDHAVCALLELKKLSPALILEPPVQINRQVEYQDFDAEPAGSHGDLLRKLAQETHDKQLERAMEQGRRMGDRLYDAMMGEGYANLVKAWERKHGRKPSVDDLHMMLSTGRVHAERRRSRTALPPEERSAPLPPAAAPAMPRKQPEPPAAPAPRTAAEPQFVLPVAADDTDLEDDDATVTLSSAKPHKASPKAKPSLAKKLAWLALHGSMLVSSGAAITYFWLL